MIRHIANRVAVMYLGRVVEYGSVQQIFEDPQHPYTQALLRSLPGTHVGERKAELEVIEGSVPEPFERLSGCAFAPRCREAEAGRCDVGERPVLMAVSAGHTTACLKRQVEA